MARNDTFEQAENEPAQVVAGDAAQPLIGQFFSAVLTQVEPANIETSQGVACDGAQPLEGHVVFCSPTTFAVIILIIKAPSTARTYF